MFAVCSVQDAICSVQSKVFLTAVRSVQCATFINVVVGRQGGLDFSCHTQFVLIVYHVKYDDGDDDADDCFSIDYCKLSMH